MRMIETEYTYSRQLHSLNDRTKVWKSLRESTIRIVFRFYCISTTGALVYRETLGYDTSTTSFLCGTLGECQHFSQGKSVARDG